MADFSREIAIESAGLIPIGIDEAGRGPLAGPVVACATLYRNFKLQSSNFKIEEGDKRWKLVRDSKKLSERQREAAFSFVQEQFHVGVGIISAETIDRVNILQATFLAMKAAIADLKKKLGEEFNKHVIPSAAEESPDSQTRSLHHGRDDKQWVLLVDGNQLIPNLSLKQETVVEGDGKVKSIAAASIIAKVTRDRLIILADHEYPAYGFARHKGYGTREHMEALRKYGPTPIHRQSFRPVQLANPETVNKRFSSVLKPKKR